MKHSIDDIHVCPFCESEKTHKVTPKFAIYGCYNCGQCWGRQGEKQIRAMKGKSDAFDKIREHALVMNNHDMVGFLDTFLEENNDE